MLILPACLCLSDAEAGGSGRSVEAGGTVIADYHAGPVGPARQGPASGGVLDDMFGVKHSPDLKAADVFGGKLWCEVDQDANFSWKTYEQFLTDGNTCIKDASGFRQGRARHGRPCKVNRFGKGTAVLMNLSPQWYNAYRAAGAEAAEKRSAFMQARRSGRRQALGETPGRRRRKHTATRSPTGARTAARSCSCA